jgi:hypothetical protein
MKQAIHFLAWSGKASLEIEIPDGTEERFRLRAAVEIAVGNRANLSAANLRDADLSAANLRDANLRDADLRPIESDFYHVLVRARAEAPGLLLALREGRVDGSTYSGECACLVGTIANIKGEAYTALPDLSPDSDRPIERFFMNINKGDTPETNQTAKIVEGWLLRFLGEPQPASADAT